MRALPRPPAEPPDAVGELDELTLARAQRNDDDACRALVRRYERPIFALLGRMLAARGLAGLVEDVAQETFLRAFRALPSFDRSRARLSTWLLCIASRLAMNELARKRPEVEPLAEDIASRDAGDESARRAELRRALRRATAELTPEQHAAFVLREYHGLTELEIAMALELDVAAVKSRLFRARARLRDALAEVDRG